MDRFHIALFLHIVAVVIASGATAVTRLAAGRRVRARTLREAVEWHGVLTSAARFFPLSLVVFVITGGYMLSFRPAQAWTMGYIVAGLVGVALLLASGTYLGIKGKAFAEVLDKLAASGADREPPPLVPPPLVVALPVINTGIALAVAFDMVTKPSSVAVALGVVAVGIAIPAAMVLLRRPAGVAVASPAGRTHKRGR